MDAAAHSGGERPSPRRELQGPRPSPLKVSKDSFKITKKPPLHPHPHHHHQPLLLPQNQNQNQNQIHRSPVIIYAVSPKIIHTTPSDFMSLVQRLTGNSSSDGLALRPSSSAAAAAAAAASAPPPAASESLPSPAARLAAVERSSPRQRPNHHHHQPRVRSDSLQQEDVEFMMARSAAASFPGILSPGPASLQPISPSLFLTSPTLGFDPTVLGYLSDLSPVLNSAAAANYGVLLMSPGNNNNYNYNNYNYNNYNNNLLSTPTLLATPTIPSPGACWDLLNQFPDF